MTELLKNVRQECEVLKCDLLDLLEILLELELLELELLELELLELELLELELLELELELLEPKNKTVVSVNFIVPKVVSCR